VSFIIIFRTLSFPMITLPPVKLQCVVISQSVRMSVCLSVREHISLETCVQPFTSSKSRRVLPATPRTSISRSVVSVDSNISVFVLVVFFSAGSSINQSIKVFYSGLSNLNHCEVHEVLILEVRQTERT